MKRGPSIHAVGALFGALLALSISSRGAQDLPTRPPRPSGDLQQKSERPTSLTDEQRGDLFMARKEYDNAIEFYAHAIEVLKADHESAVKVAGLWNKMGICYQQKMDYDHARKAYKKAIRLNREFAQPWNNLGTTFYLVQRPKKSIKFYRHAIKLNPQSASYHLNLGTAYFARKKYERATREYRTAIQLDPEILVRNASGQGTAVETRHVNAKYYFYLAKIFASVGDPGKAVRYLERAMEEGFNDQKKILQDPDIQKISKDPAFIALMKNPPVAIKN